jgi:putative hemolysin
MISMAAMLINFASEEKLETWAQAAVFVPETLTGLDLLAQFRRPHNQQTADTSANSGRLVLIVDEYGVVQGMMTPRDLLEAITGELVQTTSPQDAWAVQREDGSWLVVGLMPVQVLKSRLDIDELPQEEKGLYNTLAGLLLMLTGELPAEGEYVHAVGWKFEVVDLDGRRIDKVLASRSHLREEDMYEDG